MTNFWNMPAYDGCLAARKESHMANIPNPNDPYRPTPADDDFAIRRGSIVSCRPIPNSAEGSATGSRMAIYALGIVVALGAVFYGLNNTSMKSGEPTKTASQSTPATQDSTPKAPAPTNNIADFIFEAAGGSGGGTLRRPRVSGASRPVRHPHDRRLRSRLRPAPRSTVRRAARRSNGAIGQTRQRASISAALLRMDCAVT